jgi:catechol O-methyltransferase
MISSAKKKIVLVTGVGMAKGLTIARLFHRRGHRVVGADTQTLCIGRVSRSICSFCVLPDPSQTHEYVEKLLSIVKKENVDLLVSVSDVNAAIQDAQAKEAIETQTGTKVVQFSEEAVRVLHDKHSFIERTREIGLQVPDTRGVRAKEDILLFLKERESLDLSYSNSRYLVKPVGIDDAARLDMPLLPLSSTGATLARIGDITFPASSSPPHVSYVVQEFIPGGEFCTHALIIRGRVRAFVACPSSGLLMHYEALPADSPLSREMLGFTKKHAAAGGTSFTGHLSFDFMAQTREDGTSRLLPIECNPRVHTAVLLFSETPEMVDEYLDALWSTPSVTHSSREPLYPRTAPRYYWIGHDLVELVLYPTYLTITRPFDVSQLMGLFHSIRKFMDHVMYWKDGIFQLWDPWPWWWMYHVYWPSQFLLYLVRGRWNKINVSTGKAFRAR